MRASSISLNIKNSSIKSFSVSHQEEDKLEMLDGVVVFGYLLLIYCVFFVLYPRVFVWLVSDVYFFFFTTYFRGGIQGGKERKEMK